MAHHAGPVNLAPIGLAPIGLAPIGPSQRCMLHRAQGFDGEDPRVMHRVTVTGAGAVEAYRPADECARSFDTTDCAEQVPREKP